jgi:LysM repeat protein
VSEAAAILFDDPPRGTPASGEAATERIAATLRDAGIDAPNSLYDEALVYARDGHLGQAHARLQMLLCLDPDDADALLLLAKVHAAQGRPSEALARLDASVAAGAFPAAGFREQLEGAIRAERAREEEHRARIAAREQGEIRTLRHETRTLRSDNVRLETEITETRVRERNWKYAALGTSIAATLVIAVLSLVGGSSDPADAAVPAGDEPAAAAADAGPTLARAPTAPGSAPVAVAGKPAWESAAAPIGHAAAAPAAANPVAAGPVAAKAPADAPAVKAGKPDAKPANPHVHTVEKGDTLYKLAARYYGDASQWERIQKANRDVLKHGKDLSLGMTLRIP